jgi:hypothetical protein
VCVCVCVWCVHRDWGIRSNVTLTYASGLPMTEYTALTNNETVSHSTPCGCETSELQTSELCYDSLNLKACFVCVCVCVTHIHTQCMTHTHTHSVCCVSCVCARDTHTHTHTHMFAVFRVSGILGGKGWCCFTETPPVQFTVPTC